MKMGIIINVEGITNIPGDLVKVLFNDFEHVYYLDYHGYIIKKYEYFHQFYDNYHKAINDFFSLSKNENYFVISGKK